MYNALTFSNTLQLRSHPDELQVKLRILIAKFCNVGVDIPYEAHHSAVQ